MLPDRYFSNKKLLIFDKDDTLTDTKSPIDAEVAEVFAGLIGKFTVAIISGSSWSVINDQVVELLPKDTELKQLYVLPASGSQLLTYDQSNDWRYVFDHSIDQSDFESIKTLLLEAFKALPDDLKPRQVYSDQVEYRVGQITMSVLGQEAPRERKKAWDPDRTKRQIMVEYLGSRLTGFDIKIGGSTSIDITNQGVNKKSGVLKLLKHLNMSPEQAVYFGDSFGKNGNDDIVREISELDTVEVANHHKLLKIISQL